MEGTVRRAALVLVCVLAGVSRGDSARPATAAGSGQAHACIFDHQSLRTAQSTCRPRAKAYPAKIVGKVKRSIYDAALTFGIPYPTLYDVARCESDLNPQASNGTHFGLYQFAPATFKGGARALRQETGIRARSYWNALDASYVAGYLFVTGKASSWSCVHWPST